MAHQLTSELRKAAFTIGRRFGIGGSLWSYYAPSTADNIVTLASRPAPSTVSAYVVRERAIEYGLSNPSQSVGVDRWRLIARLDAAIATSGTLKSQTDTTLAFTIGPLTTDQGYITGILEPTKAP